MRRPIGAWFRDRNRDGAVLVRSLRDAFFECVRLQWVQPGKRVFEALNPDTVLLEVEVLAAQQAHLGRAQPVAVGNQKGRIVPLGGNNVEPRAHLGLGGKVDAGGSPRFRRCCSGC